MVAPKIIKWQLKFSKGKKLQIFQRDETPNKIEKYLHPMLGLEGFSWNPDKGRYTYYFDSTENEQEDFKLMDAKFKSVVAFIDETIAI